MTGPEILSKEVYKYVNFELVKTYRSIAEAARDNDLSDSTMGLVVNGGTGRTLPMAKDHIFFSLKADEKWELKEENNRLLKGLEEIGKDIKAVENSHQKIVKEYFEIKEMYRDFIDKLYSRSLWKRIINKRY